MELQSISEIQIPYEEQSLTEIVCDKEFVETKDWYKEQNFMDEEGNIVARFIQKSSEDYDGEAKQLTVKRKDLFIVEYINNEDKSKHHYDIVQVKDLVPKVLHTYDYINDIEQEGTFPVRKNKLIGFINTDGEEFISPQYKNAKGFKNGVTTVHSPKEGKCGVINKRNETVIPFIYDGVDFHGMVNGYCVFHNHDKDWNTTSYIYDKNYKLVLEYKGEVKNLAHGIFAFETERNTYEIRKLNENDK